MICGHCGCFFCCDNVPDASALSPNDLQKYCSQTCATAARKGRRAANGVPLTPPPPRPRHGCKVCGNPFQGVTPEQKYCSDPCRKFARYYEGLPPSALPKLWAKRQAVQAKKAAPCPSGKIRHQDRDEALKAARTLVRQRYRVFPGWLRVYKCPDCGDWHLTSKPKRRASGDSPSGLPTAAGHPVTLR